MPDRLAAPLVDALRALVEWCSAAGVRGTVIGGVAASLQGRPRLTGDVDALVVIDESAWEDFLEAARAHGIRPRRSDALAFARRTRVLLLRHRASGIDLDVSLGTLPFEVEVVPSLRGSHPNLPAPERPFVDPDEPGELLPGKAPRLAGGAEARTERPARRVWAVPEEGDDPGEEPNLGLGSASLPSVDRRSRDTECNGKILLSEAPQDALPAELLTPGSGVARIDETIGLSSS